MTALTKQNLNVSFTQGVDTKTDPFQVSPGKFLSLQNSVFTKAGLLQKRNGFGQLSSLPDASSVYLTTFNNNLTAIDGSVQAFSRSVNDWVSKGTIYPCRLSTLPLIRSSTNQTQADSAVAPNGLVCTAFTDVGGVVTPSYKYVIADASTGQNITSPVALTSTGGGTVTGSPRVFVLGNHFVIVFTTTISAANHLQFIAINYTNIALVSGPLNISSSYTANAAVAFDGVVVDDGLYLSWNGSDLGGAIRMCYIDSTLTQHFTVTFAGYAATHMSVCADSSGMTPVIYSAFYDVNTQNGYVIAVDTQDATVLAPTQIISSKNLANITSVADDGVCTFFTEVVNAYSYDSGVPTHYIQKGSITVLGVPTSSSTIIRSVGLASKAFQINDLYYFISVYSSAFQPTLFLLDETGNVVSKLAYSNGSGYITLGLPSANVDGDTVQIAYLIKDLIQSVNKSQNAPSAAGIYSQTGINLATFELDITAISSSEIGNNLNLSGGFLWAYDGYLPVEQGFHLWPDNVELTGSASGGLMTAQEYFYQVTYEWADNQGNVFRSAPSVPVNVTTTGGTSSVTINVPTLRLTYKIANPVKIVIYRWSVAQQTYYQVTSLTAPLLNNTAVDSVSFVDTHADSAIVGNNILYTTGGVLENIAAPASNIMTIFQSRLFLVSAEDENLVLFSKAVIESTPVEMTDLLSIFVAPTLGAQKSTGGVKSLTVLDDKLILFKKDAAYYVSGQGPDNTGANSQYSDPVFITSTVGCSNQQSIVFMPNGIMFESDKGIWLLKRDLSTAYIGAAVEGYTQNASVLSAINVPETNQVRFTLSSGITLMYDYYYEQWGTFLGVPAISSTIYENLHTYLNAAGEVFQETPGSYLDGSKPVLLSFTSSWFNLEGLQGYQRAYEFYLLGTYFSPHKIALQIAYDYQQPSQFVTITPDNYSPPWGGDPLYGDSDVWGGASSLEDARIFFETQKCKAFQITLNEIYDSTIGVQAGAGFTLSGMNLVLAGKKTYNPIKASKSFG